MNKRNNIFEAIFIGTHRSAINFIRSLERAKKVNENCAKSIVMSQPYSDATREEVLDMLWSYIEDKYQNERGMQNERSEQL